MAYTTILTHAEHQPDKNMYCIINNLRGIQLFGTSWLSQVVESNQEVGCMAEMLQTKLLVHDFQELTALVQKHGQPPYRARQLFQAIYPQRATSLQSISTLPKNFLAALQEEGLEIRPPRIEKSFQSVDGTIRYLIGMADGETIETVWMPEGDGGEDADGSEATDGSEAGDR